MYRFPRESKATAVGSARVLFNAGPPSPSCDGSLPATIVIVCASQSGAASMPAKSAIIKRVGWVCIGDFLASIPAGISTPQSVMAAGSHYFQKSGTTISTRRSGARVQGIALGGLDARHRGELASGY